ncbi:MAG: fatty acyl-AMP ligase [Acidobacteria bacterium]|nr:fatty acyl-AMP ligase [Acidobacteriota bacterium]
MPEALNDAARTRAGFVFVSGGTERFVSYSDLRCRAIQVAAGLRDAGLRRGDLLAIVLADAEEFLATLFGASLAGVIPASLYPPATTSDLPRYLELTTSILRSSGAKTIITTEALVPAFDRVRAQCPELTQVLAHATLQGPCDEPEEMPKIEDIAFVQFTSGSTSSPKGVALTHANVSANVDAFNNHGVGTTPDDVAVSWLPLNHDMGLVGMAFGALYGRCPCVLLTPHAFVKRPSEWLTAITRHRGTISFGPNFAYDLCVRRVKDRDMAGLDLSSWRVAGCGAEPIHPPTLAAFAQKFAPVGFRKTSYLPSYGLAEHVLAAAFPARGRAPRTEEVSADALTERRIAIPHKGEGLSVGLVSCGKPLPEHQMRIVGENGRPLPERHVGEILLAGPSVMLGYYKRDALTAQTIRDGWLHTGDLGYLSEGELFVCGRAKDVIIVHGRKYHPQDLEWAVDGLAGVRRGRVVAFGATNHGRPDRVVIVAEPNGTVATDLLTDSIRRRIGDLFGLYVDAVALVPSGTVSRTTSGKVQRAATKARYERGELVAEAVRS